MRHRNYLRVARGGAKNFSRGWALLSLSYALKARIKYVGLRIVEELGNIILRMGGLYLVEDGDPVFGRMPPEMWDSELYGQSPMFVGYAAAHGLAIVIPVVLPTATVLGLAFAITISAFGLWKNFNIPWVWHLSGVDLFSTKVEIVAVSIAAGMNMK